MSENMNYNKLSGFVGSIVDRKIKSISIAINGSGSYLRGLTTQAQGYASESLTHAGTAANHASDAGTAASSALIVWNNFTSMYIGTSVSDPLLSSQGNAISAGAFYIRQSDGRLRYVTGFNGGGQPIWADATVTADLSSLSGAGTGIFLSLNQTTLQTVKGPITFQNTLLVPKVTSWTSQQPATATDVNDRIVSLQTSLTAEVTRATNAENAINSSRVAKVGDTMSGALSIVANGDASSLTIRNNSASGRQFRFNATNDGRFRLMDDTGTVERLSVRADGVFVTSGAAILGGVTSALSLTANRNDGSDPSLSLQTNSVTRWTMARSISASRFYISRHNSSGVFIDSPMVISENDGSVTLNKTTINDTLQTKGNIQVDATGASLILNNSSGVADPGVSLRNLGYTRWYLGRSPSTGSFYINRFTDTGVFVDTPFRISETDGLTTVSNLQSLGYVRANSSVTTPVVFTEANGNGQNIKIGDDVWIGDSNIANGLSIRGVGDFNSGFIRFGNSSIGLGCTAGDSNLKYGNNVIYHAGNFDTTNIIRVIASSNAENGGYRIYSDGYKECWGKITVNGNASGQVINFPAQCQFTQWSNVVLSGAGTGANAQDNWPAVRTTQLTHFTVNAAQDNSVTAWYQAKGY